MKLDDMTWCEVEARIEQGAAILLPVGSTEQHGPMGRIGTDTICANAVALAASEMCDAIVAPPIAYTPALFNASFPGTISVSDATFQNLAREVIEACLDQGFLGVFVVNGHGANLDPLERIAKDLPASKLRIRSWWEPKTVNEMRAELYGAWEGMHATPSEVAITQALLGAIPPGQAAEPPKPLSAEFIRAHSRDRHGPPHEHRAEFPDGRVGSHSALATPEAGHQLLQASAAEIAQEYTTFLTEALRDA
ncbi:Creatinine amidohydrolase [Ruegeria denitrificans]|uniref:Creatinine amidohydrolase n=1 Tax=Ruegeria denitrificans TaxID=1715692 RepID=A0A0P1IK47_9RHOB|nr:creatininase family protein [Ruegeria denitrificans]CUK18361.1 Creatinine amidohydrolase [Ruegeria denitrificans]